jgi:ribosomal protein S14
MRLKTKKLKSDYIKRLKANKEEKKGIRKSSLLKNKILPLSIRYHILNKSEDIQIKKTQIRNRCIITGRSRGIFTKFGISRIELRNQSNVGNIPGMTSHE